MYRIRFHGRGGQGMKTSSRILGRAFFLAGYEIQDAPRYGAERRGAPIFAYVRADKSPINERGIIHHPDLVIAADDSLMALPAAGVLQGIGNNTVVLIYSNTDAATWQDRLAIKGKVIVIPVDTSVADPLERRYIGTDCAGAAASLCNIPLTTLEQAITEELGSHGAAVVEKNLHHARTAYERMAPHSGCVKEGSALSASGYTDPGWTDIPFDRADIAAPAIHAAATSGGSQTGLWRTMKPIIDYARCNRCWWVCSTFCPDGAINVTGNNYPQIDYDHCKGCMVCVSQCPPHAIAAVPEAEADQHPVQEPPHDA